MCQCIAVLAVYLPIGAEAYEREINSSPIRPKTGPLRVYLVMSFAGSAVSG